jgi:hypothetical protein
MANTYCPYAAALLCAFLSGPIFAGEPLWLSDASPHGSHGGRHAHGGPVEIRRGVYYKHLWLRLGDTPGGAGYVQSASNLTPLLITGADGETRKVPLELDPEHGLFNATFPMPKEGFYNAFTMHQWVKDGVREVKIAKAEVLKHSCREGHDHVKGLMPVKRSPEIPLEIVRERMPHEDFHTLIGFGDEASFLVLQKGEPVRGAEVTIATNRGWKNQAVTDGEGRVSFMMIRDYYPPWHEFEKRHAQPYLG